MRRPSGLPSIASGVQATYQAFNGNMRILLAWVPGAARRRREAGGGRRRLELLTIRSYVEEPVKIGRPRVEAPGGGPMRRPADPRPAPAPGGKLLTITNCCGLRDPGAAPPIRGPRPRRAASY